MFTFQFNYAYLTHGRDTRYASNYNLQLPKPRTLYYKKSWLYNGAKLWNSIPVYIRNCSTFATFKHKLVIWLPEND